MSNWMTFWEACDQSKEGDVLECEYRKYVKIINCGGAFFWNDTDGHRAVKLVGEMFLDAKWRILEDQSEKNSYNIRYGLNSLNGDYNLGNHFTRTVTGDSFEEAVYRFSELVRIKDGWEIVDVVEV